MKKSFHYEPLMKPYSKVFFLHTCYLIALSNIAKRIWMKEFILKPRIRFFYETSINHFHEIIRKEPGTVLKTIYPYILRNSLPFNISNFNFYSR